MSGRTTMIKNDIMRAVMDYIAENEKQKVPTKNFAKVGQALGLIRTLLESHVDEKDSDVLSVGVLYEETDVAITITLPADWSFDRKALKLWKDLLRLVDEMSHTAEDMDENGNAEGDELTFRILKVFEPSVN